MSVGLIFYFSTDWIKTRQKVIELASRSTGLANFYNSLGQSYLQLKDSEKALECFNKALELDSNNAFTYAGLGQVSLREGNSEKAREYFNKVIELDANSVMGYSGLGWSFIHSGDYKNAIEYFNQALKLISNYEDELRSYSSYYGLARVSHEEGDYVGAKEMIDKALKLSLGSKYVGKRVLNEMYLLKDKIEKEMK